LHIAARLWQIGEIVKRAARQIGEIVKRAAVLR
jgi:hypothetical protein